MSVQASIESVLKGAGWQADVEPADVFVSKLIKRHAAERARYEALRDVVVQSSFEFREKVIYMADPSEANPDHQSWLVSLYVPLPLAGSIDGRWPGGEPKGPYLDVGPALDLWIDRIVVDQEAASPPAL